MATALAQPTRATGLPLRIAYDGGDGHQEEADRGRRLPLCMELSAVRSEEAAPGVAMAASGGLMAWARGPNVFVASFQGSESTAQTGSLAADASGAPLIAGDARGDAMIVFATARGIEVSVRPSGAERFDD